MDDRSLIYKIQRGQTELLNVVAERYYDDIYRFCYFLTGNQEESYDLAQETFLKFIKYVDHYKYKNLKAYLLTIARNICMDYLRSQSNQSNVIPMGEAIYEESAATDAISDMVRKQYIVTELQCLPEIQREAISLYYYDGLKLREIASITGVGLSTVKSRIKQGMEKLKARIKEADINEG